MERGRGWRGWVVSALLIGAFAAWWGARVSPWSASDPPRHPGQDELLAASWPQFVRAKETGLVVPGSQELYWAFDEVLRQGALWFLSDGEQLSIEIPDGNNPNYS